MVSLQTLNCLCKELLHASVCNNSINELYTLMKFGIEITVAWHCHSSSF